MRKLIAKLIIMAIISAIITYFYPSPLNLVIFGFIIGLSASSAIDAYTYYMVYSK